MMQDLHDLTEEQRAIMATARAFTRAFPELGILSYDRRILENARALGLG